MQQKLKTKLLNVVLLFFFFLLYKNYMLLLKQEEDIDNNVWLIQTPETKFNNVFYA